MKKIAIINLLLLISILGVVSCKKEKKENKMTTVQFYSFKRSFNSLINKDFTDTKIPAKNCTVYVYKVDKTPNTIDGDNKVVTDSDRFASGVTDNNGTFSLTYETSNKGQNDSYFLFKVFNDSMETFSGGGASPWIYQSNSSDGDPRANSEIILHPKLVSLKFTLQDISNNPISGHKIVLFNSLSDYNASAQSGFDENQYIDDYLNNYDFNTNYFYRNSFYGTTNSNGELVLSTTPVLYEYWFKVYSSTGTAISTDIIKTSKLYPSSINEYIIHKN